MNNKQVSVIFKPIHSSEITYKKKYKVLIAMRTDVEFLSFLLANSFYRLHNYLVLNENCDIIFFIIPSNSELHKFIGFLIGFRFQTYINAP